MATNDVIQIDDEWYVLASSSRADDRSRVLKHGETFAVFDRYGDIQHVGIGEQGIYHEGTRYLSTFEMSVNDHRLLLLNSTAKQDNTLLTVDMTTPDLYKDGKLTICKGTLHIFRFKLLWDGVHYEHTRILNYGEQPITISLAYHVDADFKDIFEVRGFHRKKRGKVLPHVFSDKEVLLGYNGLDGVNRRTRIRFSELPEKFENNAVQFTLTLFPKEEKKLHVTIACEHDSAPPADVDYHRALSQSQEAVVSSSKHIGNIFSSNEQFNDWINRSAADLRMLTTQTPMGAYPYAGVPWFATPFGRDGIITALQYLWLDPSLARGVLSFLATHQADKVDPASDAEPGKILHETRQGEMAELGEIPFKLYYGSVDSTPLFIMLAGAYYDRSADHAFIESIWPNIKRALSWIDKYGDCDGDGFVEYFRHSKNGLLQQGWKDSNDSIFHRDGRPAEAPIALCEVQGYVYEAKLQAAKLARLIGDQKFADQLVGEAKQLKERFNQVFWCSDISNFAIALDGKKRPCCVPSSNVGHVLYTGIANENYAPHVANALLSTESFNGWGVRTIPDSVVRYNPMSYHNGSIWPHDNSIAAMGLSRYGLKDEVMKILTVLFDASISVDQHRLPELFCGFKRFPGQGPTLYPVACSPQAWASGSVFQLLQACLGLSFSAENPQIRFDHPQLPDYINTLEIKNLRFGHAEIDLVIHRHTNDVGINVLRKKGDIDIAVVV